MFRQFVSDAERFSLRVRYSFRAIYKSLSYCLRDLPKNIGARTFVIVTAVESLRRKVYNYRGTETGRIRSR